MSDLYNFRFRLLHALYIQNLSNCHKNKYNQSISRIFGEFLLLSPTVGRPRKKYGNVCFSSTRLYLNALKFILIVLQRQPKHCKSCNMFPNCGRLYGRRLEKLYRQRKSFKIAVPGIWTLIEKICAMICIDPENLMRCFLKGI